MNTLTQLAKKVKIMTHWEVSKTAFLFVNPIMKLNAQLIMEAKFPVNIRKIGTEKTWFSSDEAWQRTSNIFVFRLNIFNRLGVVIILRVNEFLPSINQKSWFTMYVTDNFSIYLLFVSSMYPFFRTGIFT